MCTNTKLSLPYYCYGDELGEGIYFIIKFMTLIRLLIELTASVGHSHGVSNNTY